MESSQAVSESSLHDLEFLAKLQPLHHPVRKPSSEPPSLQVGYAILLCSIVFLLVGSYATLLSAFFPGPRVFGYSVLDWLERDTHYKYLVLLLIPTSAYLVIANWVGWQYYRNS